MKRLAFALISIFFIFTLQAQQVRVLFDASKAETAGNADWVIDEDLNNMKWSPGPVIGSGTEGNAQRVPTPLQSTITSSTIETYWKGALSSWGIDCVKKGYYVESLPYNGTITYGNTTNSQDLTNYNIFVLDEPNILFTAAEKTAILQFVQNGGGLFIIADHANSDRNSDGYDSPEIFNDLMLNNTIATNPFGFMFDSVSISPLSSNIPNLPTDSLLHGPMGNVTQVMWASGNTITLYPSVNPSVKGIVYNTGVQFGNKGVMVCYARFGKGKIVAMGDSSPADDGSGDSGDGLYDGWITDASGNHERLIMNGTIWLATKDSAIIPKPKIDINVIKLINDTAFKRGENVLSILTSNIGNQIVDTITFSYQLNQDSIVNEKVNTVHIVPNSFITYTFNKPFTLFNSRVNSLRVWVNTSNDANRIDDTLNHFIYVPKVIKCALDSISLKAPLRVGNNAVKLQVHNLGEADIVAVGARLFLDTLLVADETFSVGNLSKDSIWWGTFTNLVTIDTIAIYSLCAEVYQAFSNEDSLNGIDDVKCIMETSILNGLKELEATQFTIYPNPNNEKILYIHSDNARIKEVKIVSLQGEIVLLQRINLQRDAEIDIASLAAGYYFVELKTNEDTLVKPLIKQ